tara:strand:- start:487 stop:696 length:210 start_codon:yes stop_codon:yes gene_type:complete
VIAAIKAIVTALEAIPMLRGLLVDVIRLFKDYEAKRDMAKKLELADSAIADVERRLRESKETKRRNLDQ